MTFLVKVKPLLLLPFSASHHPLRWALVSLKSRLFKYGQGKAAKVRPEAV